MAAAGKAPGPCHTALREGPGIAQLPVLVPGPGFVDVQMSGRGGDWDVALFDADGESIAAGASPDSQEVASGLARERSTLTLQACRRAGQTGAVAVTVSHTRLTGDADEARANAPQMVSVNTPTRADKDRLVALDLDMTEHGGKTALGVVLHGEADRAKLRKAGFTWRVLERDLIARSARDRAADKRFAAAVAASDLPSGRTLYRELADYENEMKTLAEENPGLVRLITLPHTTWERRQVLAIEIAENVTANDGRPAFLNMGVHHAREWPSGEHAMEWAYELITKFKAGDPRATNIVRNSRNIIVPIVNPDGFNGSRTTSGAPDEGENEAVDDTVYIAARPGEYRRKNCRVGDTETAACPVSAGLAENGVDPNRNYGQFWGGPGSDSNPATQTYRGPGPFSEPETRNIRWLVSHNQVTTLITNHTTAGLVLRAPGLAVIGDPVDEHRGYKDLGDAMAAHNGYFSQKGFELYDTTGTTEDWSYNATGGYGFTFEIYCGAPNYETGDCDDPAFHPLFETMVKEWTGDNPQADHENDPGPNKGFDGQGNREAYYLAAESTINEARHSVLEGTAPAGTRLRLTKAFKTETYGGAQQIDDRLETVYDVGASGSFRWHVNPSTRPIVAKATGDPEGGEPSPPRAESTGGTLGTADDPNDDGAAAPGGDAETDNPAEYNDHPLTIPTDGKNAVAKIRIEWETIVSDWDMKLYRDDGDGQSEAGEEVVGVSQQGTTDFEEILVPNPSGQYVLRVANFAATEDYTLKVTYEGPQPFRPAQQETYTLTCENPADGSVLGTQQVLVERGEVKSIVPCPVPAGATPPANTNTTTPSQTACAATAGFRSVGVRPRGRGARIELTPRSGGAATISVFQQSIGRRVIGERLVARFTGRRGDFTWSGRANRRGRRVVDGYYFVRYRIGGDTRRVTLRRSNGRFRRVGDFYRRATCDLVPSFKLRRPVFGGTRGRSLGISYKTSQRARVTVTVLRGKRVIRRFAVRTVAANRTQRLTLPARRLARGNYRVRLQARAGTQTVTSTLTSRRL
jgi:hypothetical protein